ncbi:MAG: PQQ-like beta-propeller repeat protein [Spirochaetaceae bacterium]|jgi:hypothetical protein|nr:PQQ-like beta-propeller repeat protein [Spirochaetaceae bacterium]
MKRYFSLFLLYLFSVHLVPVPAQTTEPLWRAATGGLLVASPFVYEDTVAVIREKGGLYVFNDKGRLLWSYKNDCDFLPFLTCNNEGFLITADTKAALKLFNPNGRLLWTVHLGTLPTRPVDIGYDSRIFIRENNEELCLNPQGKKLWHIKDDTITTQEENRNYTVRPVINDNGIMFVGGDDWLLYAYDTGRKNSPKKKTTLTYNLGLNNLERTPFVDTNAMRIKLEEISKSISAGTVYKKEHGYASTLMNIAGIYTGAYPYNSIPIIFRVDAISLLASLGSPEYIPFFCSLLENKTLHTSVRAAAAEAIGIIGLDRYKEGINTMAEIVDNLITKRQFQLNNTNILVAIAKAAGNINHWMGARVSKEVAAILAALSNPNLPTTVRSAAAEEIEKML